MKRLKQTLYQWIEQKFMHGCSNYNSLDVRRNSRSKQQARQKFSQHNIPHAKGLIFFSPWTAYKFAKKQGFPLAIKPNVGGFSRGSHFPIQTWAAFWKAIFWVKFWWPTSVIETYLKGHNYRVVVVDGKVVTAMERFPPFVVGDGTSNLAQLIETENQVRIEMKLLPTIHTIDPNSSLIKAHLKKQKLTLHSIPDKNQKIECFHRVALAPGGTLETFQINNIHPKNKDLCLKILESFEARIFGIDVIMDQGLEKPYDEQKCIFLEVNSRPYLKMHEVPRWGQAPDLKRFYQKMDNVEVKDGDIF